MDRRIPAGADTSVPALAEAADLLATLIRDADARGDARLAAGLRTALAAVQAVAAFHPTDRP